MVLLGLRVYTISNYVRDGLFSVGDIQGLMDVFLA